MKKLTDEEESSLSRSCDLQLFKHKEFPPWHTLEQYWFKLLHGEKFLPISRMQFPRQKQVVTLSKFGTDVSSSIWLISSSSTVLELSSKASAMMLGER